MDDSDEGESDEGLTYAEAGVDIEASEAATSALIEAAGEAGVGGFAGLLDLGDQYFGLATDGVGTKLLVAEALEDCSTIGIDCVAMNVNDLVAAGVEPVAFVDYLAIETPDPERSEAIGEGLAAGAKEAGITLVGGETAVMPEVIRGFDLAGTAAGFAPPDGLFNDGASPGNVLVGFPSTGIHSNGLTLAREAVTAHYAYTDPVPDRFIEQGDEEPLIGELLLEPTALYTHLLEPLRTHNANAVAHITGGGWSNLSRMGNHCYEVTDPLPSQSVFDLIQEAGNVSPREMHRTFNMGTGFVAACEPDDAMALREETAGKIIGAVTEGTGIEIRGLTLDS